MALTRKMLVAMGIEETKIDQIIEAHAETVDALKQQRDAFKADAEKLPGVQKELDTISAQDGGYKAKFEKLEEEFKTFRNAAEQKDIRASKEKAVRAYYESKGIKGNALEVAMRGSSAEIDNVELADGSIKDAAVLESLVNGVFSGLVATQKDSGANTPNPIGAGASAITREQFNRMSYADRCKIFTESPDLYAELTK